MKALYPRNTAIRITLLWLVTCVLFASGFAIYRYSELSFQRNAENQGLIEMASNVRLGITLMKTKGYSSAPLLPIEATYNLANANGIIEGLGPELEHTGIHANDLGSEMISLMLAGAANGMKTPLATRLAIIAWYQALSNVILENKADPVDSLRRQQDTIIQKYDHYVHKGLFLPA